MVFVLLLFRLLFEMRRNLIKNIESFRRFFVNIHVLVFCLKIIRHQSLFLLFLEHNELFLVLLVTEMQTMHQNIGIFGHIINIYLLHLRFETGEVANQGIRKMVEGVVGVLTEALVLNFGIDVVFVTMDELASLAIWTVPIRLIFLAHFGFIICTKIIFHHHLIFGMSE